MARRHAGHAGLKKKYQRLAELAFWYGVDVGQLDPAAELGLLLNIERVQAQDTLHAKRYDRLNYHEVFRLHLLATGDLKLAERKRLTSLKAYVEHCCRQRQQPATRRRK